MARGLFDYPKLLREMPDTERQTAMIVSTQLLNLDAYLERFSAAISLYEDAEQRQSSLTADAATTRANWADNRKFFQWQQIAARDACLTVADFKDALASLKHNIANSPTLRPIFSQQTIDAALTKVDTNFPHYKDIRDAVAHPSDQSYSEAKKQRHSVDGSVDVTGLINGANATGLIIQAQINNRSIVVTRDGGIIQMELLTPELLHELQRLRYSVLTEFQKAEDALV